MKLKITGIAALILALTAMMDATNSFSAVQQPEVTMIDTPYWSAPIPKNRFQFAMVPSGGKVSDADCSGLFDTIKSLAAVAPDQAADALASYRKNDPKNPNVPFSRTFGIHVPSEFNLLSDVDKQGLAAFVGAGSPLPSSLLVPYGIVPDYDAPFTLTTSGRFEALAKRLGVPVPAVSVSHDPKYGILLTVTARDLYCDIAEGAKGGTLIQLGLTARVTVSIEDEIKWKSFYDGLAAAVKPVFDKGYGKPARRAAMLGYRIGSYLDGISSIAKDDKEKVLGEILDKFFDAETMERNALWQAGPRDPALRFDDVSSPFPLSVALNPVMD